MYPKQVCQLSSPHKNGMKKTIAIIAVAVLSFALLAGCGSKADPPVKPPDTTSPSTPNTTAPVTPQDDRESVAKAATSFFVNLTAESKAFEKTEQPSSYAALDKMFSKSLSAVDLTSFDTKEHTYLAIMIKGSLVAFIASGSPKVSVNNLYAIKDVGVVKITGDKATFKSTDIASMKVIDPVEEIAFNKVDGKWLLDGEKYNDVYFKRLGVPADFTIK